MLNETSGKLNSLCKLLITCNNLRYARILPYLSNICILSLQKALAARCGVLLFDFPS